MTMLLMALAAPMLAYLYASVQPAEAAATEESNPRSNYWRAVREGDAGYSAVTGQETNVLVQNGGQNWRQVRNGPVANYGGWFLFLSVLGIAAFFVARGRIEVEQGASGQKVSRWSLAERTLHWYTAILFMVLAVTGLSLLFGKALLIPLLGPKAFAGYAQFALSAHNYVGPLFSIGVLLIIVFWIPRNLPNATDAKWFAEGGGMVGNKHPSAGFANGGEKVWFWLICTVGVGVVVSGFVLNFPNFEQTRETMQIASIVHAVLAIVWIAAFFGHAYIGTLGTEGALEGMTTGKVDVNWAKQHHDQWYEEVKNRPAATERAAQPAIGAQAKPQAT
jgi:formate dehydrogenase subunit gamma